MHKMDIFVFHPSLLDSILTLIPGKQKKVSYYRQVTFANLISHFLKYSIQSKLSTKTAQGTKKVRSL